MALIYSSFTQNFQRPLPGLTAEFTRLVSYFNEKKIKERVDYQAAYGEQTATLTAKLADHQDELRLFHFSGHSDRERLDFPEGAFERDHLVGFLHSLNEEFPRLDCVFLNGCSNEEIVNRLAKVPVVIGTRSKILDRDAIRFTDHFFRALLGGGRSYRTAFQQACKAVPAATAGTVTVTRSLALRHGEAGPAVVNDYFMVVNNEKVAGRGFPLHRTKVQRILNWMRYVGVVLTLAALVLAALNWSEIVSYLMGRYCLNWQDESKCNILVAGFNNADANTFISDGINSNMTLNPYLEARFVPSLEELVQKNKTSKYDLPGHCNFDFLMTGAVDPEEKRIDIELIPFTGFTQQFEEYRIGSLYDLRDSILSITDINKDQFIISRICVKCAAANPKLRPLAEAEIRKTEGKAGFETTYQELNEQMAALYLQDADTAQAIASLARIASVDINDKSLAALEEQSRLQTRLGEYQQAYETQSRYVEAVAARLQTPQQYLMAAPPAAYEPARRELLRRRATLVADHPTDFPAEYARQAVLDLKNLQVLEMAPERYQGKIDLLCKRLDGNCGDQEIRPALLKIRSLNGGVIAPAKAEYQGNTYPANNNGIIAIPCSADDCLGQNVTVSAPGFQNRITTIERVADGQRIYLHEAPVARVRLRGRVIHPQGKPLANMLVRIGSLRDTTDSKGVFDFGEFAAAQLPGQTIRALHEQYEAAEISVADFLRTQVITLKEINADSGYTISGRVKDCRYENTIADHILINNTRVTLSPRDGSFKYQLSGRPGQEINVQPPPGFVFRNDSDKTVFKLEGQLSLQKDLFLLEAGSNTYTIRGRLVSNGEPFVGLTVYLAGTANGTVTDINGSFQLQTKDRLCGQLVVGQGKVTKSTHEIRQFPVKDLVIQAGDLEVK